VLSLLPVGLTASASFYGMVVVAGIIVAALFVFPISLVSLRIALARRRHRISKRERSSAQIA
jgi:hypothetical protein